MKYIPTDIQKYIYTFVPRCIKCNKVCWYICSTCDMFSICADCSHYCQLCFTRVCCLYVEDMGGYEFICNDCYWEFLICYM